MSKLNKELVYISKTLNKKLANISKMVEKLFNAMIKFMSTKKSDTSSLSDASGKNKTSSKQSTKTKTLIFYKYIKFKMCIHYEQVHKVINNKLSFRTKIK